MNHKGFIENSSLSFVEKVRNIGFGEKIPCSSGSLASYTSLKWMEVHVFIKIKITRYRRLYKINLQKTYRRLQENGAHASLLPLCLNSNKEYGGVWFLSCS